jgi:DNA-binding transcriptional regulator GbsR (MarR family)
MTNTTAKKPTKRTLFNRLLTLDSVKADVELVNLIKHEIELLDKKNTSDKKPTATQLANASIKTAILETMEENHLYTITELTKVVPNLPAEMSNQRMSALVRQLKDENLVVRVEEKGKAFFRLA